MPAPTVVASCQHCRRVMATRSRGLCCTCYKRVAIRLQYPICDPIELSRHRVAVPYCRRCACKRVNRPRGLCWRCYYTPGIRAQYPPVSIFGCHQQDANVSASVTPDRETMAMPKTSDKIAVMAERVRLRQSVFHPDDARA